MTIHPPPARTGSRQPGTSADVRVPGGYRRGEPGFRRLSLALFTAGLATFALLYAIQALLPALSDRFGVSPATSGLTVSLATGTMALTIVPVSALSERYGRTTVMTSSVVAAALLGLALAACTSFWLLLGLRAAQGIALAGLPATAMAYLAEQVHPASLGQAIGLYVAGNSVGGLSGRLLASLVGDLAGWRTALVTVGVSAVACVLVYRVALPPSAHPARSPAAGPEPVCDGDSGDRTGDGVAGPAGRGTGGRTAGLRAHLADPTMRRLYLLAMLLSGQFVTVYNYLSYRLLAAPFGLPQSVVGFVFVIYLAGTYAAATGGRLADRVGRRPTLLGGVALAVAGILLTLPDLLSLVVVGVVALTAGFFAAHSTASGWVSHRARAARAQAAALYLCAFYAGSSLIGWLGGICYAWAGWAGTAAFVLALLVTSVAIGSTLPAAPRRSAAGQIAVSD